MAWARLANLVGFQRMTEETSPRQEELPAKRSTFTQQSHRDAERISEGAKHYGTKLGHFETLKIHFPTSEGVSEVSERANE